MDFDSYLFSGMTGLMLGLVLMGVMMQEFELNPILEGCEQNQSFEFRNQKYECRATGEWAE